MNEILAFIQFITICLVLYFEYKKKSSSVFLWATLIVMFGLPHFLSVILGIYHYSSDVMSKSSLFVITFNLLYLTTRFIILRNKNALNFESLIPSNNDSINSNKPKIDCRDKRFIKILISALLFSTITIIYTSISKYGGVFNTSWGGFFADSTSVYDLKFDSGLAMIVSKYLIFASGGVIIPLLFYKRYNWVFITSLMIISYSMITRNRISILPVFVSMIIFYMAKNSKIRLKQIVFFVFSGFFIIYTVYALRVFRHYGTISNFILNFDIVYFNNRILEMILTGNGELGLRDAFYYFIQNNNDFPNFGKGHSYIRLLFIAIPTRFSFGLKPPDFAISMGSAYLNDFSNTIASMHGTLYGDCYANMSWWGIALAIFWAFYVAIIDRLSNKNNIVIKSALIVLFGCVYVIIGRGSVYNGSYIGFISGIFLLVLNKLIGRYRIVYSRSSTKLEKK